MTSLPAPSPTAWENEGQRLAPLLDELYAVVVAGTDPIAASALAVGLARVQGIRRRVALADLVGEAPPLQSLVTTDDPHGISDSFLYGVSLNKIARPVNDAGNVFLMPSGTESVAHESVYANERWRRLAAGFHQVGALLLVVAVPGTPGFNELCGYIGALMPVGDTMFPVPVGVPIIAAPAAPAPPLPPTMPTPANSVARARVAAAENSESRRTKLIAALVTVGAIAVAVGAFWPQIRASLPPQIAAMIAAPAPDTTRMLVPPTRMDSTSRDSLRRDTSAADSALINAGLGATSRPVDSSTPPAPKPAGALLVVANPADSITASGYAVYYATANTLVAAVPTSNAGRLPAVAVSPVEDNGEQWFRVTVGAFPTRTAADTLLAQLRRDKVLGAGSILRVPYALRLDTAVALPLARVKITQYATRAITAYALRQADGTATVYTGAFETPAQATTLANSLKQVGITPVLVYRTGRTF